MVIGDLVRYTDLESPDENNVAIIVAMDGDYEPTGWPIEIIVFWQSDGTKSVESSDDLEVVCK